MPAIGARTEQTSSNEGCNPIALEEAMKAAIWFFSSLAVAIGTTAAGAATKVTFERPESYTDAALRGSYGVNADEFALREIGSYMKRLGDRYVAPGHILTIKVLDVDLAGEFEPLRTANTLRVLRDGTWPRIKVRYTLAGNGRMLKQGEETIASLDYLMTAAGRLSTDPLRFEKAMLADWFRERFGAPGR
jgi:hypothetical protein